MHDEPPPIDDELLVQRCRDGDRQTFAVLVERHWGSLYGWLYKMTWSAHTAEDLAQDAFMKAWTALPNYASGPGFRAWLFRIARNGWVDHRRRAKSGAVQVLSPNVADPANDPLQQILGNERDHLLRTAISRLPDEFREALLLRSEQALSFAEIAEILDSKEETVRWRVFKARQILLKQLAAVLSREELKS